MARPRIEWLDSLRGLAMFFVIFGHAWALPAWGKMLIYSFHMPLFFAISGAVFRVSKYDRLRDCALDKAKGLLLPYLLLYLVNIPLQLISFGVFANTFYSPQDLLLGFLTGSVMGNSACWPLWFLPCLYLVSVLFWMLARLEVRTKAPLWLTVSLVFALGVAIWELAPGQGLLHWKTVPMAMLFYYLGHAFMKHRESVFRAIDYDAGRKCRQSLRFFATLAILLVAGLWMGWLNGKISMMSNIYHNYGLMLGSACCTSLALAMVTMALPKVRMLDFAGKNSLGFFGLHRNLLHGIENCTLNFPLLGSNALVATAVVWAVLFPLCAFGNRFFPPLVGKWAKPMPKAAVASKA
ncbi:MAG: acyltransferase [Coriobacteriia bacterium]|nr:acyltransferase [Coriobacteriia bacterium]